MWLGEHDHIVSDLPDDSIPGFPSMIYVYDKPLSEAELDDIIYMLQMFRLNDKQLTEVTNELKRRRGGIIV